MKLYKTFLLIRSCNILCLFDNYFVTFPFRVLNVSDCLLQWSEATSIKVSPAS